MAATLSLRNLKAAAASRPAVARSRTTVRVQAFQVTMKTPEGACKKFELEAGKDLLEVGVQLVMTADADHASLDPLSVSTPMRQQAGTMHQLAWVAAIHLLTVLPLLLLSPLLVAAGCAGSWRGGPQPVQDRHLRRLRLPAAVWRC